MKNWTLFFWLLDRLKIEDGKCVKCFRNSFITKLLNLTGVRPSDAAEAGLLPR